jgi:hypothetical protein
MNDTSPLTINGDMTALAPFGWQWLFDHGPGLKPDGIK